LQQFKAMNSNSFSVTELFFSHYITSAPLCPSLSLSLSSSFCLFLICCYQNSFLLFPSFNNAFFPKCYSQILFNLRVKMTKRSSGFTVILMLKVSVEKKKKNDSFMKNFHWFFWAMCLSSGRNGTR
jgi:hypothetical protein